MFPLTKAVYLERIKASVVGAFLSPSRYGAQQSSKVSLEQQGHSAIV
jgi:hypothetical protein